MSERTLRQLAMLPALGALALFATAHQHWWAAIPCAAWGLWAVFRRAPPVYRRPVFLWAGIGAALVGLAGAFVVPGTPGLIPAPLLGPLCTFLAVVAVYSIAAGRSLFGWTWCALLAALSLTVPWSVPVRVAAAGLFLAFGMVMAAQGVGAGGGLRGWALFAVFLGTTFGVGTLLERTVHQSEGAVMGLLSDWMRESFLPRGFGLEGQLGTPRTSKVEASDRALFEVEGAVPERLRSTVLGELVDDRWHQLTGEPERGGEGPRSQTLILSLLQDLGSSLPTPAGSLVEGNIATRRPGGIWSAQRLRAQPVSVRFDAQERLPEEANPGPHATHVPEALRRELDPFRAGIFSGQGTAAQKAAAVEAYFRDGFEYSLDVELAGRGHPLAVLLRERRPAYCTYFASAMAILLRLEGIPARVVGGFAPGAPNPLTGVLTVRERDAHAWVEVFLPEEGRYVPFDPTPWRSRDALLPPERQNLMEAAAEAAGAWVRRGFNALRTDPWGTLGGLATAPWLWILIAAGGLWRLWPRTRASRWERKRRALESEDPALVALRSEYLRILAREGRLRPGNAETDPELLNRLEQAHGAEARSQAEAFLRAYQRARFGGGPLDPATLRASLEVFSALLRRKAA